MTQRRSMSVGEKQMFVFCTGIVVFIVAALVVFFYGEKDIAWMVSNGGTFVWMMGWLAYLSLWHSRSRWPGKSAWGRLVNMLTFTR